MRNCISDENLFTSKANSALNRETFISQERLFVVIGR